MTGASALDVLIVSLGSTGGLRTADEELAQSLRRAGASVAIAASRPPRPVRTLALIDLSWARAARAAAEGELARRTVNAVIYSSTTAALLWPRAGMIRFDAPSSGNRPGRHGLWQRPLERRRMGQASLLLPWSEGGLAEAPAVARRPDRALVLPVPVHSTAGTEPPGDQRPSDAERDIAAITYAAHPSKKGLDRVLSAWRRLRGERPRDTAEELVVAGAPAEQLEAAGLIVPGEPGIRVVGMLAAGAYRALLRRSRVFVCAPRREDYGLAQLEALADGCLLVTSPAPGPYAALPIARELDARLIGDDLQGALRAALDDPLAGYAERAQRALAPFSREAVDRVVAERLLPRLLA
jgi:glycosyltransferase involved in cell wall biosynthesis